MGTGAHSGKIRYFIMRVEIDKQSGFCGGVIRAISTAERFLDDHGGSLYSLGAIVHNEEELSRLQLLGLKTVSTSDLPSLSSSIETKTLLIRAHGEPPCVYKQVSDMGFDLIDCTCPVVLGLQKQIRDAYARMHTAGGRVIIYGKDGHPEVLGLVGQVDGDVIVVQTAEQLEALAEAGEFSFDKPVELFSQTTMSPEGYDVVCGLLRSKMSEGQLLIHNTICSQVASRHRELASFARGHDVILFVAGSSSSNGKVLCDLCRRENPRTHHIGSPDDIDVSWFAAGDFVGICGATSTPKWLLEQVADAISQI